MYKHAYTCIHTYTIHMHTHIHTYIYIHIYITYIIHNNKHPDMHTGTHLDTNPRGWEASLPEKVSMTSSFSPPSGSYYPRLALHKKASPFRDAAHHSLLAPICRYALPHPLPLVGGSRSTDSETFIKL